MPRRDPVGAATATRDPDAGGPPAGSGVPVWVTAVSAALVVLGLAVAAYLSYEHGSGNHHLFCSESGRVNCQKVTTSSFSVIAGVPVAYLGLAYFVVGLFVMLPALWRRAGIFTLARLVYVAAGLAMVLYLVWVELFRLHAICLWCTGVHVITFLLFCVTLFGEALREPGREPGGEHADA